MTFGVYLMPSPEKRASRIRGVFGVVPKVDSLTHENWTRFVSVIG
jgi:hypothetical protein